ncbi:MAG TPA: RNA-binding S4 domain-containing protein [Burkholderiaceae bacterium]|jgi:ribosome-associated heat shock protein Hsp15|nr:RNA-binding S4 domain-containing protein [Burkholderiaceae bacterium]
MGEAVRLDKWLWAARLYRTRTLATQNVILGRVEVNGAPAKPSRELHVGDRLTVQQAGYRQELVISKLAAQRGSATIARTLYEETAESLAARDHALQQRRLAPEPALSAEPGRPTKRNRRALADWERWSASVDD